MKRSRGRMWHLLAILLALVLPAQALAGPDPRPAAPASQRAARRTPEPRATHLVFGEGDEVTVGVDRGEGTLVTGERRSRQSSLIKVRASFLPELIKSAEDL